MATTYSHSRISAFEQCPKKYELGYIIRAPRGPETIEAFLGNRVHDALEWLYREAGFGKQVSADELVARFDAEWRDRLTGDISIVRDDRSADDYRAVGEKALRDYHAGHAPFDQGVTIGLELDVKVPLDDEGQVMYGGRIDRVSKVADGVWEIHDYKTSSSLMTQQAADADRQLALYEYAVRSSYPEAREVELVWHYLRFGSEVRSRRTPEQLDELRQATADTIRTIERAREYPTRTSSLCDWCEYRPLCPAWRHQADTSRLTAEERASEDGVTLVDRYVGVADRVAALKAEQDELRDAIVALADRDGLDALFGTTHSIKVFRYTNAALPGRDDPGRAAVEKILRDDGLLEGFEQLDVFRLSKAIAAGDLPSDTLDRLGPYVTIQPGAKLYSRKRR